MTSTPDELAVATREIALAALYEITAPSTVGPDAGHSADEGGSVTLRFQNRLPGYPGWYWTVTVAQVEGSEPTVLEVELMPGDSALLAPDWVPWAERLAEYRAHQAELAEKAAAEGKASDESASDESDDSDDQDDDEDDDDADESDLLHAGDLDGVDIDELDESDDEDESDDSDDDADDSDDGDDSEEE